MAKYLDRKKQTAYLRKCGVKIGDAGLANMASDGKGPKFRIINGMALSTEAWLDEWMDSQPAVTPKRREKAAATSADATATATA